MKVLLVRPPSGLKVAESFQRFLHLEPLSLEIVAGGVPDVATPSILDLIMVRNPEKQLRRKLKELQPDVIGFSGYSNQVQIVREYAHVVKSVLPGSVVVVGGIHATIAAGDYRVDDIIDYVVRGDGSGPFADIISAVHNGNHAASSPWLLRVADDSFDTLAAQPLPAWSERETHVNPRRDLVDRARYFCVRAGNPNVQDRTLFPETAAVRTSIGCPYRCNFCAVRMLTGGKYIQRDPEAVVDEIARLPQKYIYFVDDEMFINAQRCRRIAELLSERNVKKVYTSWARSDTICSNVDLFRLWKEVGLETLYVGVESLQEEELAFYNKKVDVSINRRAVDILRELGIGLHAALMVQPDFGKENFEQLHETIKALAPAEITFTVFSPSPGSELYAEYEGKYLFEKPYLYYDCMHTVLPTRLPLKTFYRYFSLLYLFAFKVNPWRANRIKVRLPDIGRLLYAGMRCGYQLNTIYKDYDKNYW